MADLIWGAVEYAPVADRVPGDSNLDGRFNSSDLVYVFRAGKYEDGIPNNATFQEGDWNLDGDFSSADLVLAFSAGTYEAAAVKRPFVEAIDQVLALHGRTGLDTLSGHPERPGINGLLDDGTLTFFDSRKISTERLIPMSGRGRQV